ncbi:MAG: serine/threonine protein kinase, partial [Pyrinomonadaceae bacterium]
MIQNRYLVVQMIGRGGMGEVYLAVDQRLGSAVALKRTFFNDNNALGSAFEREARILGRLRHPVLPKVIDHFAENGDQFLVMEHISGDDLAKRLENATAPFPVSWVMFWADQMLDALSYLHSHEPPIVHRDIKPQNLKLTDENHIVLLDFGLSKDFDTSATGGSLNSASVAGYSPHFASMEQIRGTGTDPRSDLYSFSATLYQLLTNTIPADALTRADALLGGDKDPIVPLNEINPEISSAVSDVILKAAGLRQDQRYSSAAEMQKALRRAFKQEKPEEEVDIDTIDMRDDLKSRPQPPAMSTNPSEMATRAQPETPSSSLEETIKADAHSTVEPIKQSDVKTQVIPVQTDGEMETRVSSRAGEKVSAASAGANPMPAPGVQVKVPKAAPIKKKSSRTALIIGALLGLLLLGAAGAGAGWFYYSNYYAVVKPSPTPTPVPASPTPSPTVEVLAESDTNTSSNSNTTDVVETNTNSDSAPQATAPGSVPQRQPATGRNPSGQTQPPPA